MDKVRILIVEDAPIIAADLEDRLTDMGYDVIESLASGEAAIKFVQQEVPDLILMDIQLAGRLDGIETTKFILEQHQLPIIFLTSNTDAATFIKAKATQPHAFIGKPFRGRDLQYSIELAINRFNENAGSPNGLNSRTSQSKLLRDRIFVKDKEEFRRIFLADITKIEAEGSYCEIYTEDKKYLLTITLKDFLEGDNLPDWLIRVHRSFAVNIHHVEGIVDNKLIIGADKIPISKKYLTEVREHLRMI